MRFALAMAASAALWVQPAQAATITVSGNDIPVTGNWFGSGPGTYRLTFTFSDTVTSIGYMIDFYEYYHLYEHGEIYGQNDLDWSVIQTSPGPSSRATFRFKIKELGAYGDETAPWAKVGFISIDDHHVSFDGAPGTTFALHSEFRGAIPEPSTWALMIVGFGAVGAGMRSARRRADTTKIECAS